MPNREEQVEALRTLLQFNRKLTDNMGILEKELTTSRKPDTDQYLKSILDAINWEISVVGSTLPVLNEGKERVNKAQFNEKILDFNKAVQEKNEMRMATTLHFLKDEFVTIGKAALEVV